MFIFLMSHALVRPPPPRSSPRTAAATAAAAAALTAAAAARARRRRHRSAGRTTEAIMASVARRSAAQASVQPGGRVGAEAAVGAGAAPRSPLPPPPPPPKHTANATATCSGVVGRGTREVGAHEGSDRFGELRRVPATSCRRCAARAPPVRSPRPRKWFPARAHVRGRRCSTGTSWALRARDLDLTARAGARSPAPCPGCRP